MASSPLISTMAVSCIHVVLLLCLVPATVASPRPNLRMSPTDFAAPSPADASRPTTFFEVDRPLRPPPGSSGPCSTLLLSASFAFTFTKPPATATYSPPPCLASAAGGQRASAISLAVLEWRATCQGVQYDRIFGVWLGGAELLRGSTAEPLENGVVWSVSKDVTRYASLLAAAGNSTLAVFVENLVNSALTGVYYANVTLHLYLRHTPPRPPPPAVAPADLIVPMSRGLPLNDGLWYKIQNATDAVSASVTLPSNTYRAVVEVFVSFHGDDEFWWTNPPGAESDGPFREVTVRVDGVLAGAAWPFPVIFTGGINPLLWRPITGIGSFSLPTYDVELTPLLGKMLDGKAHELGFAVTNAVDVWYVDANLHLWLDPGSTATAAGLVSYVAPELAASATSSRTTASRRISAAGWVESSYGNITTNATQTFAFDNTNTGDTVNQTTVAHASVAATGRAGGVLYYSAQTRHSFPLFWDSRADQVTITHGLEETTVTAGLWSSGPRYQSLRNTQRSSVVGGGASWGIGQTYKYEATDECYSRNVTSSDYSIVSDQSSEVCAMGPLR